MNKTNWTAIALGVVLALVLGLALFGKMPTPFAPAPTQTLATPTPQVIVVTATDESPAAPADAPTQPATPYAPTPMPQQPTEPAAPGLAPADFGQFEVWTIPNSQNPTINGTYTINPDQIGIIWWKVTLNRTFLTNSNCEEEYQGYAGAILYPGTYTLQSPGRIRVWQVPAEWNQALIAWWTQKVQEEAGPNCQYVWYTFGK